MSVGTAVAISNNVGLADYIHQKDLGWVFDLNALSLATVINNAAKRTDRLDNIRNNAPQQIRNDFNEDNLTQQYMAMYDQILSGG